eukprot:CAMPEP_0180332522 /NCGR_PEP_ID=MMETSP0988-20121125/42580_1 /TAXON_ID=697907 /ORGANISM="non described non described, Strain CCMP2293" /LENGTH=179 /DNA_ID=CAMNT_0022320179 /DNA_START=16 /DNA_END=550 /DNA_ORIENTATION=-
MTRARRTSASSATNSASSDPSADVRGSSTCVTIVSFFSRSSRHASATFTSSADTRVLGRAATSLQELWFEARLRCAPQGSLAAQARDAAASPSDAPAPRPPAAAATPPHSSGTPQGSRDTPDIVSVVALRRGERESTPSSTRPCPSQAQHDVQRTPLAGLRDSYQQGSLLAVATPLSAR